MGCNVLEIEDTFRKAYANETRSSDFCCPVQSAQRDGSAWSRLGFFCCCLFWFFKTEFLRVTALAVRKLDLIDQAGLELTEIHLSAGIKGVHHHCPARFLLLVFGDKVSLCNTSGCPGTRFVDRLASNSQWEP